MVEAPKVYCPKEKREVPIWWCLGSFVQQRYPCPELLEATVDFPKDYAVVKCKAQTYFLRLLYPLSLIFMKISQKRRKNESE